MMHTQRPVDQIEAMSGESVAAGDVRRITSFRLADPNAKQRPRGCTADVALGRHLFATTAAPDR